MKNFWFRLFLSLCIIFLSGYSQLHAHGVQASSHPSSTKLLQYLEQDCTSNPEYDQDLSTRASVTELKKAFKLRTAIEKDEKEDDHVVTSLKKYSDGSIYFSSCFWALTLRYLFRSGKAAIPSSEHLAHFPSFRRHLLFQVFRI